MTTPPSPPDGTTDGFTVKVPDVPQTMLAFRVWRFDRSRNIVLSMNAPTFKQRLNPSAYGVAMAMAGEPDGGWSPEKQLEAKCDRTDQFGPPPHPKPHTCGIYATTDMDVIDMYLSPDNPILGVVEMGGRVIPHELGFRARYARLAAVLLVDSVLTLPRSRLEALAEHYKVPALVPHSRVAEEYRDRLVTTQGIADEVQRFLDGLR